MLTVRRVLSGAMILGLAATALQAEQLGGKRDQVGRGGNTQVSFDRNALARGVFTINPSNFNNPNDASAAQMQLLAQAMQAVRDRVAQGLKTDAQILAGGNGVPPLSAQHQAILNAFGLPGSQNGSSFGYKDAASAVVLPNTHGGFYYTFDIDRILNEGGVYPPSQTVQVHSGEPSVYNVDVSVPVREVQYPRIVSEVQEVGLTGGWNPTNSVPGVHYRIPLDQYAVRASGNLAIDPATNTPVSLQILGPGVWGDWSADGNVYKYQPDPTDTSGKTGRFRVAMALGNEASPNVFPSGGHVHCGFIYDFANPINCHAVARTKDPTNGQVNGQYGTTVVVSVNNSGKYN